MEEYEFIQYNFFKEVGEVDRSRSTYRVHVIVNVEFFVVQVEPGADGTL